VATRGKVNKGKHTEKRECDSVKKGVIKGQKNARASGGPQSTQQRPTAATQKRGKKNLLKEPSPQKKKKPR